MPTAPCPPFVIRAAHEKGRPSLMPKRPPCMHPYRGCPGLHALANDDARHQRGGLGSVRVWLCTKTAVRRTLQTCSSTIHMFSASSPLRPCACSWRRVAEQAQGAPPSHAGATPASDAPAASPATPSYRATRRATRRPTSQPP